MDFVRVLMRYFAYLYHGLLALFLFAISLIALVSNQHTLRLELLPWWKGAALTYWLLGGALFGLAAVVFAIKGKLRVLLLAWCAVVAVLMVKGFVFSGYRFARGELSTAVWLMCGALLALAGAWFGFRADPYGKKKY